MKKQPVRVAIPRNVDELLVLANKIYQKHQADAAVSPLNTLVDFKWDSIGPNVASALAKHEQAEALRKQMEQAYEERDNLMGNVDAMVKASRDLLKATHKLNPRKLGEWGFVVDDTPTAKIAAVKQ